MNSLTIRKKSLNTWLHTDSVFGYFIISKFYFNSFEAKFKIVEEGNTRLEKYLIPNITLYDDTDGGVAETFSTITELSLRLEELQYPAFDRTGLTIFPSMEQITNVNVTDIEDGQVLAWDESTSKWVNITVGGLTTPNLQQVTDVGNTTTNPIRVNKLYVYSQTDDDYYLLEVNEDGFQFKDSSGSLLLKSELGALLMYNNSGFRSLIRSNDLTENRIQNLPNKSGTFAFLDDITSIEPIVVSSNVTATLNRVHNVVATSTLTDPTPTEGMGYLVNVINGVATVGGVAYGVGSELFRVYDGTDWVTYNKTGYIPLTGTTTGNEVTGVVDFKDPNGDITVRILQGDGDEQGRIEVYGNAGVGINNFTIWGLGSFFGSQDNGATQYQFQLSSDKGISNNVDVSDNITDLDYTQKIYVDNQRGKLIQLTTTEILALTPEIGRLYYNTTINEVVFYDGTNWKKLSHTNM